MDAIPFITSDNNYRLRVPLSGTTYLFDVHWNSRDSDGAGAWYFDLREEDETPIALGVKVVLGAKIGYGNTHPFFKSHTLDVLDTSGEGRDAGYDDLGARVALVHHTVAELVSLMNPGPTTT